MPSLLDMTDIPMKNILEKCGFKSVLTLRKVCRSLRNFIDDSRFKTDLQNIDIAIDSTGFSVRCVSRNALSTKQFSFAKDWTSRDLTIILKMSQNTKLSGIYVNNAEGLDELEHILKNQTRLLQTKSFAMKGSEILKVLPYLDSKTLKAITITAASLETNGHLDGIEQFIELEQFKNAVELYIDDSFLVQADLRKFFHFQRVCVNLHEKSLEKLVALKEAFVTLTHMEFFELLSLKLNEDQLEQVFGTPFHENNRSQWYFEIQNCKEHVLNIDWNLLLDSLLFYKLETNEVPQDAVIQH